MITTSTINRGHPLLQGAMLWWIATPSRMGGSVMVDQLHNAHGTFISASGKPTWGGAKGRLGGWASLTLDGAQTQYLRATTPAVTNITLAAWVKVTDDTVGQEVFSNTADTTILRIFNGVGVGVIFLVVVAGTYYGAIDGTNIGTGWRHLVGTYDGDTICVYVDGRIGSFSEPGPFGPIDASPNNLLVGVHSALASYKFTGSIDDIVKWDRALSAAEVRQWYNLSRQRYPGILQSHSRQSNTAFIAPYLANRHVGSSRPFPFTPSSPQQR